MNARRSHTRSVASVLGGAFIALTAFSVAPAAQAAPLQSTVSAETAEGCVVSDATLTWGVLERFRAYISGSIANGGWTLIDGTAYETPSFIWSAGSGELDADAAGAISFAGGIHFEGHEGVLKIDLANPTVELTSATEGYLLLDLTSTKQTGEADIAVSQVRAVKIDLEGAIVADGETLEITEAPGRLTSEGAAAFAGFYSAGEEMDPISVTASAPGCVLAADGTVAAPEATENAEEPPVETVVVTEEAAFPWLPIGIGAVALIVIGIAGGMLLRGGKPKTAAAPATTPTTPAQDGPAAGDDTTPVA